MGKANGQAGVIVTDCDLKAMYAISKAMASLTKPDEREQVIAWFQRKYAPETRPATEGGGS
jgi:hypothetical protein